MADPESRYFGALLEPETFAACPDARLAETRFEEWLPANPLPAGR